MFSRIVIRKMAGRGGGGLLREEGGDLSLGRITRCAGELALCSRSGHLQLWLCSSSGCLSLPGVYILLKIRELWLVEQKHRGSMNKQYQQ